MGFFGRSGGEAERAAALAQRPPVEPGQAPPGLALATFAAGCFWGVEDVFRKVPGVVEVVSGYTGGHVPAPTYERVCQGDTGHAEAVLVTYDPTKVRYEDLLEVFWRHHDPTTPNRQGPDVGTQYRSAVFCHGPEQLRLAQASKAAMAPRFSRPIVTEVQPASTFWPAEEYHQRYVERTGRGACHVANW
ncbi:peptide-methionine (S)-S-oxide reductase MsrA [Aciditerrimonas ferrireducens]|nr:peptide-methionine (S)-S-oxide reductase MsrA [Aciditerrimonas ferrireducens]MCK4176265.1 peptide-methionine (S)-S-oxide reductase MsrA [Aciditerrimonas ferrireducens]